jgi:3-oxoacyl-[acyl-carrier protein] reductase
MLEGRVALVTGSTRGIGLEIARTLAAHGARVAMHGSSEARAKDAAQHIPDAIGFGADMGERAEVIDLVERVTAELGPVDVLVNNAGVAGRRAITRITDEEWDRVIAVNLTGPLVAIRTVVPMMKRGRGGVILNLVSDAATVGNTGFSSYAASKGGLIGLTRTLARELAGFQIRVNALSPSAVTDMTRELPPEVLAGMVAGGMPGPEAIADSALFLVSDLSAHVNGEVLRVAGVRAGT